MFFFWEIAWKCSQDLFSEDIIWVPKVSKNLEIVTQCKTVSAISYKKKKERPTLYKKVPLVNALSNRLINHVTNLFLVIVTKNKVQAL